jgi:TonB family protein
MVPTAPPVPPAHSTGAKGVGKLAMRSNTGSNVDRTPPKGTAGSVDGMDKAVPGGAMPRRGDAEVSSQNPGEGQTGSVKGEQPGEPNEAEGDPLQRPDLRPSQDQIARAVGSGSNDYLKDVDEGEDTLLNTKRWKYASFFNRVKRAVAQEWHPDVAYRLRDPSGQIYGQKNRLTVLKVSLKPDGSIREPIVIEKPCGVDFLDDEAVNAFKQAQPFPNPPQGLVDKDSNLITFRFGFFFEISSSPTFRVFRFAN